MLLVPLTDWITSIDFTIKGRSLLQFAAQMC